MEKMLSSYTLRIPSFVKDEQKYLFRRFSHNVSRPLMCSPSIVCNDADTMCPTWLSPNEHTHKKTARNKRLTSPMKQINDKYIDIW